MPRKRYPVFETTNIKYSELLVAEGPLLNTVNSWWLRGHSFYKTNFLSGTSPLMFVVVVVDRFYAALFSVLKQSHCALVVFLNVHQSGILTVLFSFYTAGAM